MSAKAPGGAGSLDVTSWLAELHMECYKKNLEHFETIKVSAACVADRPGGVCVPFKIAGACACKFAAC